MSNNSVIVNKYAKAAFEIAQKSSLEDAFLKDLDIFYKNVSKSLKELSNPTISKNELEKIITDIAEKLKTNPLVSNFLIILSKSRRIGLLEKICKKLEELVKAHKNILQVNLVSAKKLKEDQIEQIKKALKTKYSGSKIEIEESIQEDIIGGVIIKIGSYIIDTSIKSQLSEIYNDCKSIL